MKIIINIILTVLYTVFVIMYGMAYLIWNFKWYYLPKVTVNSEGKLKSNYYYLPHQDFLYKNMYCFIWKIKTPYHKVYGSKK